MQSFHNLCRVAVFTVLISACSGDAPPAVVPEEQPVASVRVAEVVRDDVQSWVFAEGTARATRREFLSFSNAGRIAFVNPTLREGDEVQEGELIAYQDTNTSISGGSGNLDDLQHAAVREAAAELELAHSSFQRYEALIANNSVSQQEYDEARARYEQAQVRFQSATIVADESRIIAPMNGILARLNIEQGYHFSPQQVQTTREAAALNTVPVVIIDPSSFEITVNVPYFAYNQITVGASALVQSSLGRVVDPNRASDSDGIQAYVYSVSPSIDPETRTFTAKVRTFEGETGLLDGEYVTAWIAGNSVTDQLTIPVSAIRFENSTGFAMRVDPQTNRVTKASIQVGLNGGGKVQVNSGLSEGDLVVTTGNELLSDGDLIRVIGNDSAPVEVDESRLQ